MKTAFAILFALLTTAIAHAQILTCTAALAAKPQGPFPCSVTVTWVDQADNETSYELQRRLNKSTWATIGGSLAPNTTSVIDATLQQSATEDNVYDYRVQTINSAGSSPSISPATASFTITKTVIAPKPATGITVTFKGADGILDLDKGRSFNLKDDSGTFVITSAAEITVNYP